MAEYIRQDHHLPHGSLEPHITNADRIRMMSDEELANYLFNSAIYHAATTSPIPPLEEWLAWLKQDAKNA